MKEHASYGEVMTLVDNNIPVLLTGEAGSGKTTLAMHVAEAMKLIFFSMSMTRQTTLSHLLGFINVNGKYVESSLRRCFEHGGLMLLDEIDAGDANVMLALNTIENGYLSFPDALVQCHPNFRLVATANPQDEHSRYTGRSKLDAATLDRFDIVDIDRDDVLEQSLVDIDTHNRMQLMRKIMKANNCLKTVSMRDSIRYQKRKALNLVSDKFVFNLAEKNPLVIEAYNDQSQSIPKHQDQADCTNVDELIDLMTSRTANQPKEQENASPD